MSMLPAPSLSPREWGKYELRISDCRLQIRGSARVSRVIFGVPPKNSFSAFNFYMIETTTSPVEAGVSPATTATPPREREKLTKKAITADHPTWCPGCGDFAVLA